MTLDALETAVFGYKKESVYRFITETEQKFSEKLIEQEENAQRREAQLQARLAQLEEECAALRERLAQQQEERVRIAGLLSDAAQIAETLQQESVSREQAVLRMFEEERAVRQQVFEQYLRQLRGADRAADTPAPAAPQPAQEPPQAAETAPEAPAVPEAMPQAAETAPAAPAAPAATPQAAEAAPAAPQPAPDAARSVRVGGTTEACRMDTERNMSLFRRRVYPAE